MPLDNKRRQVFDLLLAHTQVPRSQAEQILDPLGMRVGDRVIANVSDEQIDALLAAARLSPRGPHFEAAWNEVVNSFPGKQPQPEPQPVVEPTSAE